jgi:hypothetical protein
VTDVATSVRIRAQWELKALADLARRRAERLEAEADRIGVELGEQPKAPPAQ